MRVQYEEKPIEAASGVSEFMDDGGEDYGSNVFVFFGLVWVVGLTLGLLVATWLV